MQIWQFYVLNGKHMEIDLKCILNGPLDLLIFHF